MRSQDEEQDTENMHRIRLDGSPGGLAKQAYSKGHYIEAIQLLHGFIEGQARAYIAILGHIRYGTAKTDAFEHTAHLRFSDAVRTLRVLNQLSDEECSRLLTLNRTRNKVVHEYYSASYWGEDETRSLRKEKFDEVFQSALDDLYLLRNLYSDIEIDD